MLAVWGYVDFESKRVQIKPFGKNYLRNFAGVKQRYASSYFKREPILVSERVSACFSMLLAAIAKIKEAGTPTSL